MTPKILVVLTSQDKFASQLDHPTGWFLPEFAHPWNILKDKTELIIASPKGGKAPLDAQSVEMFANDPVASAFFKEQTALWDNTKKISDINPNDIDAVLYVGGHGPMWDLYSDEVSLALVGSLSASGKPIAAVCHGPAALIKAKSPSGQPLLRGASVTGFSNLEEDQAQLSALMPFMLETELNNASGGGYVKADDPWAEKVVVSQIAETHAVLITGQNPASASSVGKALLEALRL